MAYKGKHQKKSPVPGLLVVLVLLLVAVLAMLGWLLLGKTKGSETVQSAPSTTTMPTVQTLPPTEETEPPTTAPKKELVSTATLGSMGDLLMHGPLYMQQYQSVNYMGDGTYDFSSVFEFIQEPLNQVDYAVANLETTLCGTDNGYAYSSYPHFNCPDEIAIGAKNAGFDMLLTVNNHSYDTTLVGLKRTLETVRETGLKTLGTMLDPEEPKYTVENVNGINIGMMAFTYADRVTGDGRPVLNKNSAVKEAGIVNYFTYNDLTAFYSLVETYMTEMKAAGAETTVLFLHWGTEYQTQASDTQKAMAQKLCDLGVDVIIGGHPHVLQPMDLLTSTTDTDHKTVILYSMGNAVSNQRKNLLKKECPTGHSEDGVLFSVTFQKWSDGSVNVSAVEYLPTWVNKYRLDGGTLVYTILPLDPGKQDSWQETFGLDDTQLSEAQASLERSQAILAPGWEACQSWIAEQKQARDGVVQTASS